MQKAVASRIGAICLSCPLEEMGHRYKVAMHWDSYCCWRSVSANYTAFFKNNCAGLGEEEGTGKPLEMSPSDPMSPATTKQKSPSLQVQH